MGQDLNKTCIQMAEEHYDRVGQNFLFERDFYHDLQSGWVIDVPYSFGMGYFYEDQIDGSVVLFVAYATGDFKSLLRYCLNLDIDKIEFMRNFTGQTKRYEYDKFIKRTKPWVEEERQQEEE